MAGGEGKVRVYVDVREERSGVPGILESLGVMVIFKQLHMGDYLVSEDIVVERKSSVDFAKSLFDGRLFEQASRLSEHYSQVYFIVEGGVVPRRYKGRERSFYGALVALLMDFGVRVIYTDSRESTAYVIYSLARRAAQGGGQRIVIHKKPKIDDIREWQLYILQSFPGIGRRTAEKLLETFGSLEAFCRASIAELSRVEGVGDKRAELIKRILVTPYRRQASKRRSISLEDFYREGGDSSR